MHENVKQILQLLLKHLQILLRLILISKLLTQLPTQLINLIHQHSFKLSQLIKIHLIIHLLLQILQSIIHLILEILIVNQVSVKPVLKVTESGIKYTEISVVDLDGALVLSGETGEFFVEAVKAEFDLFDSVGDLDQEVAVDGGAAAVAGAGFEADDVLLEFLEKVGESVELVFDWA